MFFSHRSMEPMLQQGTDSLMLIEDCTVERNPYFICETLRENEIIDTMDKKQEIAKGD